MKKENSRKSLNIKKIWLIIISIIISLVAIDQIIKYFIISQKNYLPKCILGNIVEITYVQNTGAAFSIGAENPVIIVCFSIVIIAVVGLFILKNKESFSENFIYVISIVFAGAIGNFIDRIFRGFVVDYIYLKFINFPIFNFADICIVCGCIIAGIIYVRKNLNS